MEKKNNKTYWPHMILGFLVVGLTLGYWTVKSAVELPVQESNDYMLKYQKADLGINEILESKKAFDQAYTIQIQDIQMMVMTDNVNSKRAQPNAVKLHSGVNHFSYAVTTKDGSAVDDANVSFLLTRPHTRADDVLVKDIVFKDGKYTTDDIRITKPGRYTLQFRAKIGNDTGYSVISAYLKP